MPKRVEVKDVGIIEIPDDTTPEDWINSLTEEDVAHFRQLRMRAVAPSGGPATQISDIERRLKLQQLSGMPVGTGEITDPSARWKLGLHGVEEFGEQRKGLMKEIPGLTEQDVVLAEDPDDPTKYTVLVRQPGTGEYVELNTEAITGGDVMELLTPQGLGAAVGSAIPGVAGLPGMLGRYGGRQLFTGIGGALGRAGEELLRPEPAAAGELPGRAAKGALEEIMIGQIGEAMSAVGRGFTGQFEDLPRATLDKLEGLRQVGLEVPTLQRSPSGQYLERQLAAVSVPGRERQLDMFQRGSEYVNKELARLNPAATTDELVDVTERWRARLEGSISTLPRTQQPVEASAAALSGLEGYMTLRKKTGDKLYTALRKDVFANDIQYDVRSAKQRMAALMQGYSAGVMEEVEGQQTGRIVPETVTKFAVPAMRAAKTFMKLPDEVTHLTFVSPAGRAQATLQHPGVEVTESSFDQLLNLKHQFDVSITGKDSKADALAAEGSALVTEILENPTGRVTRGYKRKLARANEYYRNTIKSMEQMEARGLVRSALRDTPEKAGRDLITPNSPDRAEYLKRVLTESGGEAKWDDIRGGYFDHLINNPSIIEAELKAWERSPKGKASVFNAGEAELLQQFAEGTKRLANPAYAPFLRRGQALGRRARAALLEADPASLKELVAEAGGKDSPMGHALQYGLMDSVLEASEEVISGRTVLNHDKAERAAKAIIRDEELFDIVGTPQLRKVLDNLRDYFSFIPWGSDTGSSILGAEIASARSDILHPMRMVHANAQVARRNILALMLGSNKASQMIDRVRGMIPARARKAGPMRVMMLMLLNGIESMDTDLSQLTPEQLNTLGMSEAPSTRSTYGIQLTPAQTLEELRKSVGAP